MALLLSLPSQAADLLTSIDANLYAYAGHTALRNNSLLNPSNQIAKLTEDSATLEVRLNLKAEYERWRLTLRPILLAQAERNDANYRHANDAYLSQWQLRLRASESWSLAAGREVLNWGPAQFRSPSSPFYFDNGRSNPLRELPGVDALKLSWTPDLQHTLTLARITASGQSHNAWLLKAEQRGDDWALGGVVAQSSGQDTFLGAHAQFSPRDELMLYAEAASTTRADALQSPADSALPFSVQPRSARHLTALLGTAYTFESGRSLNLEWLHDSHGYSAAEQTAYFARAATSPTLAGLALAYAPALLGRDYVHLVWQSNLMDSDGYWRLMATHNLTDRGSELSGYVERKLDHATSYYLLGMVPIGHADQEFASLLRYQLMAGIKRALP